jgi:catechol 2,3-dioxygenase-like lactoylglutathione lyase family enzyme
MSAQPAGLGPIGQIAIAVQDLDAVVDFYRDKLGMAFLFRVPDLAFFDCGGIRLMLSRPEKPEFDHPSSIIYFKVDDIHAIYQALHERGVPFDDEPHLIANMETYDLWMAFFRDQDKNLLGIMSEQPHRTS